MTGVIVMPNTLVFTNHMCTPDDKPLGVVWRLGDIILPVFLALSLLGAVVNVYVHDIPITTDETSISRVISEVAVWP